MTEEPTCIVCLKRVANVRQVCSTCSVMYDATTGERLTVKQRRIKLEEDRKDSLTKDLFQFRTERPR